MKRLLLIMLFGVGSGYFFPAKAQQAWPRPISLADGAVIYVNSLLPDSLSGDILAFRAAFVLVPRGSRDTLYGSFHALAVISVNRNDRTFAIRTANVLSMQLAETVNADTLQYWKDAMECGLPAAERDVPVDELLACATLSVEPHTQPRLGRTPPRIVFVEKPTALAQIDGIPQFRRHRQWNVGILANSPNVIISGDNGWFYLYGGHHWYIAPMSEGPYHLTTEMTPAMRQVTLALEADNQTGSGGAGFTREPGSVPKDVVITLVPAELIQTKGTPAFATIPGTSLRYVTNTENDIFQDTTDQRFYLLLGGRWYGAERLVAGNWSYVAPDSLPAGFSRIPEGNPKDNVLACVAGTEAAREALLDAAIPQTARIRRTTTTGGATYDLGPRFRPIAGTRLQYAVNSTLPVFSSAGKYYCVDHGVWFVSIGATGPWMASPERPEGIDRIPPQCPLYYCRFVYIYGYDKDYIYTGYTSGYLNAFVDGGTVVYGTGYQYSAWMGTDYHPQPWTWGFNARYSPWFGWCFGADAGLDWLNSSAAWGRGYGHGGWWGAPGYRPPYFWHSSKPRPTYQWNISVPESVNYNNDLYQAFRQPASPAGMQLLIPDGSGSVCRPAAAGKWEWRRGNDWTPVSDGKTLAALDRQLLLTARSQMRQQNFLQALAAGWAAEKKGGNP